MIPIISMGYDFKLDRDNNIVLETGEGGVRNYGRDFMIELPIVTWLAYKQFVTDDLWKGNLFNFLDLPESIERVRDLSNCQLDKVIDQALGVSRRLPGRIGVREDLNYDLEMMGLQTFNGPENEFMVEVTCDSFDILKDDGIDLSVETNLIYSFVGSFYELISGWSELEYARQITKYVYGRLKAGD